VHAHRGVAELLPGGLVAAAVGVGGHPRHQAVVLEQEDAGPLDLAELGELPAGGAEEVVHRLRRRGGLDETEEHLRLGGPALLRPAGPGLGEGGRERGGHLAEQVGCGRGGGLDGQDADHLAVDQERLAVRRPDPALGELPVRQPVPVGPGRERPAAPDDGGHERGAGEQDGGARGGRRGGVGRDGDRLPERDDHPGGRLVHPDRHPRGAGGRAQAGELLLERRFRVERGRRRQGPWHPSVRPL
jgi:hypothetical protein